MKPVFSLEGARHAIAAALANGTSPEGLPAAQLFQHGTMTLFYYEPRDVDLQPVHTQDEIYLVASGSGTFVIGPSEDRLRRLPFGPGDTIFAPAGAVHRFEDFSTDFGTWVVMWGPEGGEQPTR